MKQKNTNLIPSIYFSIHNLLVPKFLIKILKKRWYEHPNYLLTKGTRRSCLRDAKYALLTGNKAIFNLELKAYKNWPINTYHISEHIESLKKLK